MGIRKNLIKINTALISLSDKSNLKLILLVLVEHIKLLKDWVISA